MDVVNKAMPPLVSPQFQGLERRHDPALLKTARTIPGRAFTGCAAMSRANEKPRLLVGKCQAAFVSLSSLLTSQPKVHFAHVVPSVPLQAEDARAPGILFALDKCPGAGTSLAKLERPSEMRSCLLNTAFLNPQTTRKKGNSPHNVGAIIYLYGYFECRWLPRKGIWIATSPVRLG